MNPVLLERAREYAFQPSKHTQGVVVVRHGVIVAEWYEDGRDATSYAGSWSSAKSIASAVIGIALDRGDTADVDVRSADYFPEWRRHREEAITLRDASPWPGARLDRELLHLRPRASDIAVLASQASDDLAYVSRGRSRAARELCSYSSADTMLLSGALQAAVGRNPRRLRARGAVRLRSA